MATPPVELDITIVIPSYNRGRVVEENLAKWLALRPGAKEVILVDDHSDAESEAILRRLASENGCVRYIRQAENGGQAVSRSAGFAAATGKYIVSLDDDSWLLEADGLQRVWDRMESMPTCGILAFNLFSPGLAIDAGAGPALRGGGPPDLWCCLPRGILRATGYHLGFLRAVGEESDLSLKVRNAGYEIVQDLNVRGFHDYDPARRSGQALEQFCTVSGCATTSRARWSSSPGHCCRSCSSGGTCVPSARRACCGGFLGRRGGHTAVRACSCPPLFAFASQCRLATAVRYLKLRRFPELMVAVIENAGPGLQRRHPPLFHLSEELASPRIVAAVRDVALFPARTHFDGCRPGCAAAPRRAPQTAVAPRWRERSARGRCRKRCPHDGPVGPGQRCRMDRLAKQGLRPVGRGKHCLEGVNLVWSFDTSSLEVFEAAKGRGLRCILDMSTLHPAFASAILEEAGDGAAAVPARRELPASEAHLARRTREMELADCLVVASSFVAESLLREGNTPGRIRLNPYGVDLGSVRRRRSDLALRRARRASCSSSWFSERKGVYHLLDAWESVRDLGRRERPFVLRGATERTFRVGTVRCPSGVEILGRVPHAQLPGVFLASDVFVFPTLLDGFGMVILEAMAAGLPVIATPNSDARRLIQPGTSGS